MKKRSYFSICILLFLITPACDKFHDNIQPADDLPIDAVYKSAADLESALNGVYNSLQSGNLAGANLIVFPDLLGGNGTFAQGGFPETLNFVNLPLRSGNLHVAIFWTEAYKTINLINVILHALETIDDPALTPALRARIEGEALFIRGYLYFELVRYFGVLYGDPNPEGGVPLVLRPVLQKSDLIFPARASVQAVYDQAISDISKARDLLPTGQPFDRANIPAAKALLAKIAFQTGDYTQAASLAKDLIENYGFALTNSPKDFFQDADEDTDEMIWAVAYTPADPSGNAGGISKYANFPGISVGLKADFESITTPAQQVAVQNLGLTVRDLRSTGGILVSADTSKINKYERAATADDDTPIIRLAEIILMRAEALARADELQPAIDLLNQIRSRSLRVVDANGDDQPDQRNLVLYSLTDFPNGKEDLIDAIVLERRVELCFEGNYFQDMIRLKRDVQGLPYDECRLRLPIPQRERDVNKNLSQHPCYE